MKTLILMLAFFRLPGLDFASMGAGITGGWLGMKNADELERPNFTIPGAAAAADEKLWAALQFLSAMAGRNAEMVDPAIRQAYGKLMGIDTSGLVDAGMQAGNQFSGLADNAQTYAALLGQQAMQQFGAGQDIYNLGRDPNNQLHDRMQQQVVDASRAGQSARGLAMGPYGAGLENKAVGDFNMDWQDRLLGRASAGLQGMNQANYLGGMDLSNSMNIGAAAPGYTMAAGQAPIAGQQAAYSAPIDWSNMYTQAQNQSVLNPQLQVMNSIYPYLGMGAQAQQSAYGANYARDIQAHQMQQQSQMGIWGGGQSGTNYMQGNQSGAGDPMNWIGMGDMGGMMGS